jgi:hypothetical protein
MWTGRAQAGLPGLTASNGAALRPTEQPIDTSTAAGKCFLDMLRVFAEFETNLRKERQLEGIAKAAGVYKGRPASINASQVRQLKADGMGPSMIAKTLGIGRASVYRALGFDRRTGGRSVIVNAVIAGLIAGAVYLAGGSPERIISVWTTSFLLFSFNTARAEIGDLKMILDQEAAG